MQVLQIVTEKLTSWLTGKKIKRVYYPYQDDYDINVLIGMLQDFEFRYSYQASIIVMTRSQKDQLELRELAFNKVMGCDIEIDDFPRGCIVIDEEF
jgi:NOL1/NOP2/fmu family ribosome biogenesis protein